MDKAIQVALADELLDTIIHKFQIPGSGVQLKVQAEAIKLLVKILEENTDLRFPDVPELVDQVLEHMPACYGGVPTIFYQLRRAAESVLRTDDTLNHVVEVLNLRGCRSDLNQLLPVLRNPDTPPALKEQLLDHGMFFVAGTDCLNSVKALVDLMGKENKEKLLAQIAPHVDAAKQGEEIIAAAQAGDWDKLQQLHLDPFGMMEVTAKADAVLDALFRHYRGQYYDERR